MTLHHIIDLCIDRGRRRLCLSPRQFKVIRQHVRVINNGSIVMFYRSAIITTWSK